jgi:hypothetical protein
MKSKTIPSSLLKQSNKSAVTAPILIRLKSLEGIKEKQYFFVKFKDFLLLLLGRAVKNNI